MQVLPLDSPGQQLRPLGTKLVVCDGQCVLPSVQLTTDPTYAAACGAAHQSSPATRGHAGSLEPVQASASLHLRNCCLLGALWG